MGNYQTPREGTAPEGELSTRADRKSCQGLPGETHCLRPEPRRKPRSIDHWLPAGRPALRGHSCMWSARSCRRRCVCGRAARWSGAQWAAEHLTHAARLYSPHLASLGLSECTAVGPDVWARACRRSPAAGNTGDSAPQGSTQLVTWSFRILNAHLHSFRDWCNHLRDL